MASSQGEYWGWMDKFQTCRVISCGREKSFSVLFVVYGCMMLYDMYALHALEKCSEFSQALTLPRLLHWENHLSLPLNTRSTSKSHYWDFVSSITAGCREYDVLLVWWAHCLTSTQMPVEAWERAPLTSRIDDSIHRQIINHKFDQFCLFTSNILVSNVRVVWPIPTCVSGFSLGFQHILSATHTPLHLDFC